MQIKNKKTILIVLEEGHGDRYTTPGKRSPDPAKHGGPPQVFEGELVRGYAEYLEDYILGEISWREMQKKVEVVRLCPGPLRSSLLERRLWIDKMTRTYNVIHLSLHTNAAGNKGWYPKASGAGVFPHKTATLEDSLLADKIYNQLASVGIGCRFNRPVKRRYSVLTPVNEKRKCLARCLIEFGFHTNKKDVIYMTSTHGKKERTQSVVNGLLEFIEEVL